MTAFFMLRLICGLPFALIANAIERISMWITGVKHLEAEIFILPVGYVVAVNGETLGTLFSIEDAYARMIFFLRREIDLVRDAEIRVEEWKAEAAKQNEAKP